MKRHPLAAALLLAIGSSARGDLYQAPYGFAGRWRIYETPRSALTFKAALAAARTSKDPVFHVVPGSLVSVTSAEKNVFLYRSMARVPGDTWIGLTDRQGAAFGASESQGLANNRQMGWAWTNSDSFQFQLFGDGEPNDAGGEDACHYRADGFWNDTRSGFGLNEPLQPNLPGTSQDESANAAAMVYMVEYPMEWQTPLPGIRFGSVFPPCAAFGLPRNQEGHWSVREIRGRTLAGHIFDAVDRGLEGLGEIFETQATHLDFTDPDTNPAGGPVLGGTPFPFRSNDYQGAGSNDDNILAIATARIHIREGKGGLYTVRVHSDDGFALRIKGAFWLARNTDVNHGYVDPLDRSTLVFERGTGDADTLGFIQLEPGDYDAEFVTWEGGNGAYYEVTATSGDASDPNVRVQWQPFGSNADLPAGTSPNSVRLAAPATVSNANLRERGNVLPAMRYLIDHTTGTTAVKAALELNETDMPNNNGGDNYIAKVTGMITVAADANGNATPNELIDITFRLNCDDGASMRVLGQDFLAVNPGGEGGVQRSLISILGDQTMTADYPTGDTFLHGLIKLTEGSTYAFECYMYEYGSGSKFNLYWQLGDRTGGMTAATVLSTVGGAVRMTGFPDPAGHPGLTGALVENAPIAFGAPMLTAARSILAEAVSQGVAQSSSANLLVLRDGDDICCGRPGYYNPQQAQRMPNGGPDHYLTKVTGQIVVDDQDGTAGETLTLTFGLFADDGAELRITGRDFNLATDSSPDGTAALRDVGGDMVLSADYTSGNTNAFGRIQLPEGTYSFEVLHFEGTGDSGLEVWWAAGDRTATGFDANVFRPLNNLPAQNLMANHGVHLVAPPNDDMDGDGMPGAWEFFFLLNDANAADAALDSDGDGQTNLQEYYAGTIPQNAGSRFFLTDVSVTANEVRVTLPVQVKHYYKLYASASMATWTEVAQAMPAASTTLTWALPRSIFTGPKLFFRASVRPCD